MDEDGNEEDNDIAKEIWGTPIHRNAKQRENTASAKRTVPHANTNTNTTVPSSQETSKTGTTNETKKTLTAPGQND